MEYNAERVFIKRKTIRKMLYKNEWLYNLELIIIICFIFSFINMFLFNIATVKGVSMEPTFQNEDILIVSKTLYTVKNGDIIVAKKDSFQEAILKRVIAKEGQTVDINFETGEVFVDGELLYEDYILQKTYKEGTISSQEYPLTVPENSYFVLGDNRIDSVDSRYKEIGMINDDDVLGKVLFKIWG